MTMSKNQEQYNKTLDVLDVLLEKEYIYILELIRANCKNISMYTQSCGSNILIAQKEF